MASTGSGTSAGESERGEEVIGMNLYVQEEQMD